MMMQRGGTSIPAASAQGRQARPRQKKEGETAVRWSGCACACMVGCVVCAMQGKNSHAPPFDDDATSFCLCLFDARRGTPNPLTAHNHTHHRSLGTRTTSKCTRS